jgi:hypothetical protein
MKLSFKVYSELGKELDSFLDNIKHYAFNKTLSDEDQEKRKVLLSNILQKVAKPRSLGVLLLTLWIDTHDNIKSQKWGHIYLVNFRIQRLVHNRLLKRIDAFKYSGIVATDGKKQKLDEEESLSDLKTKQKEVSKLMETLRSCIPDDIEIPDDHEMTFEGSIETHTINQVINYIVLTIQTKLSVLELMDGLDEESYPSSPSVCILSPTVGTPLPSDSDKTSSFKSLPSTMSFSFNKAKRNHKFVDPSIKAVNCSDFEDDGEFITALEESQDIFSDFIDECYDNNQDPKIFLDETTGSKIGDIVRKKLFPLIVYSLQFGIDPKYHIYDYVLKACQQDFGSILNSIESSVTKSDFVKKNENNIKLVKFRIFLSNAFASKKCKELGDVLFNSTSIASEFYTDDSYVYGSGPSFSKIRRRILGLFSKASVRIVLSETVEQNEYELEDFM